MMIKRCPRCGVERPLGEFAVDRSKASGRKSLCKACDRDKARRYYAAKRAERHTARSHTSTMVEVCHTGGALRVE